MKLIKAYVLLFMVLHSFCGGGEIRILIKRNGDLSGKYTDICSRFNDVKLVSDKRAKHLPDVLITPLNKNINTSAYEDNIGKAFIKCKGVNLKTILNDENVRRCVQRLGGKYYLVLHQRGPYDGIYIDETTYVGCSQYPTSEVINFLGLEGTVFQALASANENFYSQPNAVPIDQAVDAYSKIISRLNLKKSNFFSKKSILEDEDKVFILCNIADVLTWLEEMGWGFLEVFHELQKEYHTHINAIQIDNLRINGNLRYALVFNNYYKIKNLKTNFKLKEAHNSIKYLLEEFPSEVRFIREDVEILMKMNKYEKALAKTNTLAQDFSIIILRGHIFIKLYKLEAAKQIFSAETEQYTSLMQIPDFHINKIEFLLLLENRHLALQAVEDFGIYFGENYMYRKLKGNVHRYFEEYELALTQYTLDSEAYKFDKEIDIYIGLTNIYLNNYDHAIDIFEGLLKDDKNPTVYNYLGYAYYKKGELENAHKSLKKAAKINKYDYLTSYFEGLVFHKQHNKYKEAISSFDISLNTYISLKALIAKAYVLEDKKASLQLYHVALERNPSSSEVLYALGDHFYLAQKYDEAETSYQNAIKVNPFIKRYYLKKGKALTEQERYDEAIFNFYKGSTLSNAADSLMGNNLEQEGRLKLLKVIDAYFSSEEFKTDGKLEQFSTNQVYFEADININDDLFEIYNSKGTFLRKGKNFKDAVASFSLALKVNTDSEDTLQKMCDTLKEVKDESFIKHYNEIIKLKTNKALPNTFKIIGEYFFEAHLYADAEKYLKHYSNHPQVKNDASVLNKIGLTLLYQDNEYCVRYFEDAKDVLKFYKYENNYKDAQEIYWKNISDNVKLGRRKILFEKNELNPDLIKN
jgi:tetratricopeptide (TPR) repeat protein